MDLFGVDDCERKSNSSNTTIYMVFIQFIFIFHSGNITHIYIIIVFLLFSFSRFIIYELFIEPRENKNKFLAMRSSSRYLTSLKAFLKKKKNWKNWRNIKFPSRIAYNAFFTNIILRSFTFFIFSNEK